MKTNRIVLLGCAAALAGLLATGCSSENSGGTIAPGNSSPGPAVGKAAGTAVGVVVGNVAGVGTGAAEGVAQGVSDTFKNENTHVIRHWRTETTADGRTIQVPEDILVDDQGRPVHPVKPAPATPVAPPPAPAAP